jgi:MarR-like DNA-binding transcriptional regulator SgrR of sgrS sRNA
MRQFPVVPLGQFRTHSVTSDRVRDLDMTVTGTFDVEQVWLSGAGA